MLRGKSDAAKWSTTLGANARGAWRRDWGLEIVGSAEAATLTKFSSGFERNLAEKGDVESGNLDAW